MASAPDVPSGAEATTAAPSELERRLLSDDYINLEVLTNTYGEVSRILSFNADGTAHSTLRNEMDVYEADSTYTVEGDSVSVHFDDGYSVIDYTISLLPNSIMLHTHQTVSYYDSEPYEEEGFLLPESQYINEGADIYDALDSTEWISGHIGQYDNWDDEGTLWFFSDDSGTSFTGELTVTHHTSELYGYAVADTIAYFEIPIWSYDACLYVERYNNKTYAYFYSLELDEYVAEELIEDNN